MNRVVLLVYSFIHSVFLFPYLQPRVLRKHPVEDSSGIKPDSKRGLCIGLHLSKPVLISGKKNSSTNSEEIVKRFHNAMDRSQTPLHTAGEHCICESAISSPTLVGADRLEKRWEGETQALGSSTVTGVIVETKSINAAYYCNKSTKRNAACLFVTVKLSFLLHVF